MDASNLISSVSEHLLNVTKRSAPNETLKKYIYINYLVDNVCFKKKSQLSLSVLRKWNSKGFPERSDVIKDVLLVEGEERRGGEGWSEGEGGWVKCF